VIGRRPDVGPIALCPIALCVSDRPHQQQRREREPDMRSSHWESLAS
jgi:hypothetical protein